SGLNWGQSPAWASRQVGMPLSAEMPAPVITTTRWARRRRPIRSAGMDSVMGRPPESQVEGFYRPSVIPDTPPGFPPRRRAFLIRQSRWWWCTWPDTALGFGLSGWPAPVGIVPVNRWEPVWETAACPVHSSYWL